MLSSTAKLLDFVKIYSNALTDHECNLIVKESENMTFYNHRRYNSSTNELSVIDGDCMRSFNFSLRGKILINNKSSSCLNDYCINISKNKYDHITAPALNKYDVDTDMYQHVDHIQSIFDGVKKGIPIYSIVGLLNDEFEGGEFFMWDNYDLKLKKGDLIIFPSIFLYPHGVKKISSGVRYSFVRWAY